MNFEFGIPDDPHEECRHAIHELESELAQLREKAELVDWMAENKVKIRYEDDSGTYKSWIWNDETERYEHDKGTDDTDYLTSIRKAKQKQERERCHCVECVKKMVVRIGIANSVRMP